MTPILKMSNAGGLQSLARYHDMLAGNATFSPGAFESIATVTVGAGGQAYIDFISIPQTYKHLQIRGVARDLRSIYLDGLRIQFNSDTNTNYSSHVLYGNGSSAASWNLTSTSSPQPGVGIAGSTSPANVFGANVIDILDYTNTSKNKTVRALSGIDNNGTGEVDFGSSLWMSTSAITSIRLLNESATNFQQSSSFALYGIRG